MFIHIDCFNVFPGSAGVAGHRNFILWCRGSLLDPRRWCSSTSQLRCVRSWCHHQLLTQRNCTGRKKRQGSMLALSQGNTWGRQEWSFAESASRNGSHHHTCNTLGTGTVTCLRHSPTVNGGLCWNNEGTGKRSDYLFFPGGAGD